ncbi:hypothetical protein CASFOL_041148 [Castilleja foliolosa]|uniref:Protein farnesyltransferase/geranylgeranyltransferase type-1 subunit alpha n=1 Tax=Castilleja foliolosa TaxID=1961234 RepID=A0ABD3BDY0_9LAMI
MLSEEISLDNHLFWQQRRWVSEYIGSDAAANNELKFTEKILSDFPYNHHAWSHRHWVCQAFFRKDWGKAELDYCNKILKEDASNCGMESDILLCNNIRNNIRKVMRRGAMK